MPDLTTLKAFKAWLGLANQEQDDALFSGLISQVSGMILSYLSRPDILKRQWTDQFISSGQSVRMLKNYPVISVSNVTACAQSLTGYWLDPDDGVPPGRPQTVNLTCGGFRQMCSITYQAGYAVIGEPQTAAAIVTADAPYGSWARDEGVTYGSGQGMMKVAAAPSLGQYALNAKVPGQYVFNPGEAGSPILLSYSYVPYVLEQACIETVAERYKYKSRIGQSSQSANGMTTSAYSLKDMQDYVKLSLQPFKRMAPI
ncbi:hypothetical protein [Rhodopila sp.]|uniref:hypothetical protein n=1 Tax=Rhodopila sp. TaxID=2480087 RepID=UPI003D0FC9A4